MESPFHDKTTNRPASRKVPASYCRRIPVVSGGGNTQAPPRGLLPGSGRRSLVAPARPLAAYERQPAHEPLPPLCPVFTTPTTPARRGPPPGRRRRRAAAWCGGLTRTFVDRAGPKRRTTPAAEQEQLRKNTTEKARQTPREADPRLSEPCRILRCDRESSPLAACAEITRHAPPYPEEPSQRGSHPGEEPARPSAAPVSAVSAGVARSWSVECPRPWSARAQTGKDARRHTQAFC